MMATTSFANPMANSKYYMNPSAGPSPPDAYTSIPPTSQTPPSNNISPTNYHSNVNVRQLRQPRQPLYTPAALRPNDRLARPTDIPGRPRAPDTPPASQDSSFDSARTDPASAVEFGPGLPPEGLARQGTGSIHQMLSSSDSEDLSRDEWREVTGPPTTAHWKPDESSNSCYVCSESFTWFFRRHHCRRCGNLVCATHVQHSVPLDQNARFHPEGQTSKACKPCSDRWKEVRKQFHSRASSIAESNNSGNSGNTAVPIKKASRTVEELRVGSMARSEGGMVWSTF
ncbi:hypothetical protein M409DRAFT_59476 [Zasmidium cellare ATCC 36951]|uniref:FYVE-type domain-containing protein n=1 Tax=Zasmidium cellare ATCC 36951 TaxID=1080233 RepID=A0A6A6C5C8_ZASCE|nr:uncharacterized protein M409DRAFT_59476 [Zasmidium cellare ATCC 36951]KAF2160949.1 hypothetical protein M409DRAFT_59476 [Zasmidium cellare ATCC 36951]